eukprot:CAMPEP_0202973788 /NCGR_PEP_ID=MMETSP1396-20130829/54011_1 /ASSEMBLY_ACC=CAM_ASM_000872 /TAXON_ID= /ORGANISM="Pseudokeronopsis sp., Strain Brazil" /LENGTH=75 /DNA_ID=CAMNT_0049706469 /DNA_START=18 /DNA_END=245 /DNA_ORIENTATION=+
MSQEQLFDGYNVYFMSKEIPSDDGAEGNWVFTAWKRKTINQLESARKAKQSSSKEEIEEYLKMEKERQLEKLLKK